MPRASARRKEIRQRALELGERMAMENGTATAGARIEDILRG